MASAQLQHYAMIPSMNQLYPEVPDLDLIQCRLLNVSRPSVPAVVDLTRLQEQDFLCPYQTHCLALCLCCDFLACDCQVRLLFSPSAFFRAFFHAHIRVPVKFQLFKSNFFKDFMANHLNSNYK